MKDYNANHANFYTFEASSSLSKEVVEGNICRSMLTNSMSHIIDNLTTGNKLNTPLIGKNLMMRDHYKNINSSSLSIFSANHIPSTALNLANISNLKFNFNSVIGTLGQANSISKVVEIDKESVSFYNSNIKITTDNSPELFTSPDGKYSIRFDKDNLNFNCQKAVNSNLYNPQNAYPLTVAENVEFNQHYSLSSFNLVTRNTTNNQLSASPNVLITDSLSNIYSSFTTDELYTFNYTSTIPTLKTNHIFGALKFVQELNSISASESLEANQEASISAFGLPSKPAALSRTELVDYFTFEQQALLTYSYNFSIEGLTVANNGYNLPVNCGIQVDNTALVGNQEYMRVCAIDGVNFQNALHSVEVLNGELQEELATTNSNNRHIVSSINDGDEYLNSQQYESNFDVVVKLSVPSINSMAAGLAPRYSIISNNNTNYLDLSVYYSQGEALHDSYQSTDILSDIDRNTYDVEYKIATVFPNTGFQSSFNSTTLVGVSNDMGCILNGSIPGVLPSDYTYVSSTDISTLADSNSVVVMSLQNTMKVVQENYIYRASDRKPITDVRVDATGINIAYNNIGNDLQLNIGSKQTLSFFNNLTNNWYIDVSGNYLESGINLESILGDSIYEKMSDANLNSLYPVTVSLITNGISFSRESLSTTALIVEGNNIVTIIQSNDIVYENAVTNTTLLNPSITYTIKTPKFATQFLGVVLQQYSRSTISKVSIPFNLGPYKNIRLAGQITTNDTYYALKKKDNTFLSPVYLNYISVSALLLNATREFINGSTSLSFKGVDLYGFTGSIYSGNSSNPETLVSAAFDFDTVYNNPTLVTLNNTNGEIFFSFDSYNSGEGVNLLGNYFVPLTISPNTLSYNVICKSYDIDTDIQSLYAMAGNSYQQAAGGNIIGGVTTVVSLTNETELNQDGTYKQPSYSLDVMLGTKRLVRLSTLKNFSSNFLLVYLNKTVLSVEKKRNNIIVDTKYKSAVDKTFIDTGVSLYFSKSTVFGNSATYKLLGDTVKISPYSGYTGVLSAFTELKQTTGLTLGDIKCRTVTLSSYRGNSHKSLANGNDTESLLRWIRMPTTIQPKLTIGATVYLGLVSKLYIGSLKSTEYGQLGTVGCKLTGTKSRFSTAKLVPSIAMSIIFGEYVVKIRGGTDNIEFINTSIYNSIRNISSSAFTLLNLSGVNNLHLIANKVTSNGLEKYGIVTESLAPLKIYKSAKFVGEPNTFNDWTLLQEVAQIDLLDSSVIKIKVPGTATNSSLSFNRNSAVFDTHTAYMVMPPPQFIVSSISTESVSALPYVFNQSLKTIKYVDYLPQNNVVYKPFNDIVSGINNMTLNFVVVPQYQDLRQNPVASVSNIVVTSNNINIDLYSGYSSDVSASKISTLYNGPITGIPSIGGNFTYGGKTTYCRSFKDPETLNLKINLSQDLSILGGSDVVRVLNGDDLINPTIIVNNISPFLSLSLPEKLDLLPGDSIQLSYYDNEIVVGSGGDLTAICYKYSGLTGDVSFTNGVNLNNIQFYAFKREKYSYTLVAANDSVLNSVPFDLTTICDNAVGLVGFLPTWTNDMDWVSKMLPIKMNSLSSEGTQYLRGLLSVSPEKISSYLVGEYPDYVNISNATGLPIYRVSGHGIAFNVATNTHTVELTARGSNSNTKSNLLGVSSWV